MARNVNGIAREMASHYIRRPARKAGGRIACVTSIWMLLIFPLFALRATGQDPITPADNAWNYRYEVVQLLLQQNGMTASEDIVESFSNPSESVIIALGDVSPLPPSFWDLCVNHVHAGGRVLLAADTLVVQDFVTIPFQFVQNTIYEEQVRGFGDCPLLNRLSVSHPLTHSLQSIATNRTSWIESRTDAFSWQNLITLPSNIVPTIARGRAVAAIGISTQDTSPNPSGGIVVLADPSILANGMLWYGDNGNFAARLANWLSEGDRKRFVFIVNGQIQSEYPIEALIPPEEREATTSLPADLPVPKLETILDVANTAIHDSVTAERLNRELKNRPRSPNVERYANSIWYFLTALFIAFVVWKLIRRSTEYLPRRFYLNRKTARQLLNYARPMDLQNKIAAESLAREFSRQWTGHEQESEWRRTLEELRDSHAPEYTPQERVQIESILATAIFGGRSTMTDDELENLGFWVNDLLNRRSLTPSLAT